MEHGSMMKLIISLTCAAALAGCATPKYNYVPQSKQISEPPINSVNTAYVGDTLLKQGRFTLQDAIRVDRPVQVGAYTLQPGHFTKHGDDAESEYYAPAAGGVAQPGSIQRAFLADPPISVRVHKYGPEVCVLNIMSMRVCRNVGGYERVQIPVTSANSFQQTLIYSGMVGNKLNIGYREFSSDMARPAFNNDVEYDLSTSKVLGYKGARIEVLDANNEQIKYRVINNFNQAVQ
jgi:hypothetical protein